MSAGSPGTRLVRLSGERQGRAAGIRPILTSFVLALSLALVAANPMPTLATTLAAVTVPPAPTNVTATATSASSIRIAWTDNSGSTASYQINRWNWSSSLWVVINTIGAGSTSYTDNGLSPSTNYPYYICAINSAGKACPAGYVSATTRAASSTFCQCVTYVQNYVGHINTYYAKDAGPALRAMGYRESGAPMGINDIVVLQPGFAGADGAGHIAFLASWSVSGGTTRVTLRGTNQPGGWWTDHSCYDVSLWTFAYSSNWGIRFYRK